MRKTVNGAFKDKPTGAANSQRAATMLCWCLRSCCKHKAVTVICTANKLALHISSVCGSVGSPQVQSSTQHDEVAQTAAMDGTYTKTLFCWDCNEFVL